MYGIAGLLTGRTLAGRYRIDAVIGRGGMGAVYRATDERLGREVAVKVIGASTTEPGEHARLRARFHREARAAAAIRHPNVAQVHDYGTDPEVDLDFLVMELLRGEDLAIRLTRLGPPALHVALPLLRQAARGLAAGHRVGLVHRDVKPGNIFLEEDDATGELRVRVLDFGIAAIQADEGTMTHLTQVGQAPFSPAYASPEQLRGEDVVGPSSDVFSLGAVGYHLFTGVRPFAASDPTRAALEVSDAVMRLRERARALPESVYAALVRALARNPGERFGDAGLFADALSGGGAEPAAAPAPLRGPARGAMAEPTLLMAPAADHTQLQGGGRTTTPVAQVAPRPAPWVPPLPGSIDPTPMAGPGWPHAAVAAAPPLAVPAPPRRARRVIAALWNALLTLIAVCLFALAWVGAADGVVKEDSSQIYLAAAATVVLTPLALHRLAGRNGRLRLSLLASVLATFAAARTVGLDADPAIALVAVFGLQVIACFGVEWLTGRRPRDPLAIPD